jgi:vancomycin resistance protein YoaR
VTAQAAGLELDLDRAVREVLDAGRDGLLFGIPATLGALLGGTDVELDARVVSGRLDRLVGALASELDLDPTSGALRIAGTSVRVVRPRRGRVVERDVLRQRLRRALQRGTRRIEVPLRVEPGVPRSAVERVADQAREVLAQPLTVRAGARRATVAPQRLGRLLRLRADGRKVTLGTDTGKVRALVAELAADLDRPARAARVETPGAPVVVDGKGEVSWRPRAADVTVRPGRDGRVVARDAGARALAAAVRGAQPEVRLPMRSAPAAVTAEQARRIDRLIGTFTTRYEPGQPRVQNIRTIAKVVDGTLVPPGGRFSLNAIAGPRTTEKGYVKAPFIADGKIVPSVGGGVSQASTTIYNAAYFAGLRLDAHRAHSLYIDRYPPGREATLNFPDIDLVWTNDTETPVLVRATTDETSITVSLFGDNGGRRVTASPGERRPLPDGNFAITVTRILRMPDGRVLRQPVTTRYDDPVEDDAPTTADPEPAAE